MYKVDKINDRIPREHPLSRLSKAVLICAIQDYLAARARRDTETMSQIESFFYSEWCETWCAWADWPVDTIRQVMDPDFQPKTQLLERR